MESRKIAKMKVSNLLLERVLTADFDVLPRSADCPADIKIIKVEQPAEVMFGGWFWVYFTSDSLEDVDEEDMIPEKHYLYYS